MKNNEFMKMLYKMKPLDIIRQDNYSSWFRIPGGWIYTDMKGIIFIPFDNEFMEKG